MTDTYPMTEHGWTCFHCGQTFKTPGKARDHFGATPDVPAACSSSMIAAENAAQSGAMADPGLIDHVAKALCRSFYAKGSIYEEPVEVVIEWRWHEWRPQAEAAFKAIAEWTRTSHRSARRSVPKSDTEPRPC